MEKIAITSEGPTLDDVLDPRFGRAAGFIVVDPQTLQFQYVDNGASQARAQGAGIQAAEIIIQAGAEVSGATQNCNGFFVGHGVIRLIKM